MKNPIIQLRKSTWVLMILFSASCYFILNSCNNNEAANSEAPKSEATKSEVALGKDLYVAYCELCHGTKGDGAMSDMLKIKPPDLRQISLRRNGVFPEDEIFKIIDGQEALEKGHGSRTMPIWGEVFGTTENIDEVMVPKKIYQ